MAAERYIYAPVLNRLLAMDAWTTATDRLSNKRSIFSVITSNTGL
jgi:hypothetical protein